MSADNAREPPRRHDSAPLAATEGTGSGEAAFDPYAFLTEEPAPEKPGKKRGPDIPQAHDAHGKPQDGTYQVGGPGGGRGGRPQGASGGQGGGGGGGGSGGGGGYGRGYGPR